MVIVFCWFCGLFAACDLGGLGFCRLWVLLVCVVCDVGFGLVCCLGGF